MKASPLVQRIISEIKQQILLGDIEPDAHLNTQQIAGRFQISRSPARQALNILREQGFVEQRKNRGFFVIPQEKRDFQEDNEIRKFVAYTARLQLTYTLTEWEEGKRDAGEKTISASHDPRA